MDSIPCLFCHTQDLLKKSEEKDPRSITYLGFDQKT